MNTRIFICTLTFVFLTQLNVLAQKMDNYSSAWKKISSLEKKGLTSSALKEVTVIFNKAVKTGNEAQQVKAAMYQMKYRNQVEEENQENNIFFLDTLINKSKTPARNILQSMQAQLYWRYLQNNRYRLYDRSTLAEEKNQDIRTWSSNKLQETITRLYKASLENDAILKNTSLQGLEAILEKGKNTRSLRPTLYDLLANRALEYYADDERYITEPAYTFIMNDERVFAPLNSFIQTKFQTKDNQSLRYLGLLLLQDILSFHAKDATPDAMIDANLTRLAFVNQFGIFTDKQKLYEEALLNIETAYPNNPAVAQATYLRARACYERGTTYDPFTNRTTQFEMKKAKDLCEESTRRFPGSAGAVSAQNLLNEIREPSLSLETEKVNIPNQPFRSLVKYKNASNLYLRIIKISKEEIKFYTGYDNENWKKILQLATFKKWNVALPDLKDYQQHATEIKIDGLPTGNFIIFASLDPNFPLSKNIISKQLTHISNISYIQKNNDDLYVLDRENGEPIPNATVNIWKQNNYNYTTRTNEEKLQGTYKSDAFGHVKLMKDKDYYNYRVQVLTGNDELFLDDNYYNYNYNGYDPASKNKTFIFTDRSIYRPGQTVFFKGIVVQTDPSTKRSKVIKGYKTNLILFDANGQKAGSLSLETNDYGSYNGKFSIPEGLMNGQFYIQDSANNSLQYFSVEEYKRPKFITEIKKPEGIYKLNDSIRVTGTAKAYAGNNIGGASVKFRVVRKVRYPIWWGWDGYYGGKIGYPGNDQEMEITNGETLTDQNGEFSITFKAIPDENADKKNQPVFNYEVSADVTDINGETRSSNTSVAVAYQALQLSISLPEKIAADSLKKLQISSTNFNGLYEKTRVSLTIQKLKSPGRIFRERYWQVPDQFVMSKEEYYATFLYDAYADEYNKSTWMIESNALEMKDTTSADGSFSGFKNGNYTKPGPGHYKIVVTTRDKYGEEVRAEKYILITDPLNSQNIEPVTVGIKKGSAVPGENIAYDISTGFAKIWLIHTLVKADETDSTSYLTLSSSKPLLREIAVGENDRGGIYMNYAFVKHNRVYTGAENFTIPWNNKEISVSYETFRDKTLPGSEEKWKIRIKGPQAEKLGAEALISMYDASLDQFKPHSWNSLQSLWPVLNKNIQWISSGFEKISSQELAGRMYKYLEEIEKKYDALAENGWTDGYGGRYYFAAGNAAPMTMRMEDASQAALAVPSYDSMGNIAAVDKKRNKSGDTEIEFKRNGIYTSSATPKNENKPEKQNEVLTIRKNFNETAFFFPSLTTDADGNITFSFTIPEALTQWKMMTLAHSKNLQSGYSEKTVITQKPLMVVPNATRFLREGDTFEFSAKVTNMSDQEITGTSQLELLDAATNKPIDGWFKNIFPVQYFTVAAGQTVAVRFPIAIPFQFNSALTYRIRAVSKDNAFSDGEEASVPVLTNRLLVTESMPLNMRNTNDRSFRFDKLLSNNSSTLTHHALTVEYTSNPAFYAVQALPYLMEFPYECAEQTFNRYYANVLAAHISNRNPAIKAAFEKWKITDTAALFSNLQKNQELKSILLQETPWVVEAKDEATQKKNIALLFDMMRLGKEKTGMLNKLKDMQSSNGGFSWFKGGPDDRYITQYIITGIGHLRKLEALNNDDYALLKPILEPAISYLDERIKEEYDNLKKIKAGLKTNNLSASAIQYLYMRSFFTNKEINKKILAAYSYYQDQSKKYWLSNGKYMQAMIALSLYRSGQTDIPRAIIKSLRENALYKEEMGMYWKDLSSGGYYWYQAPVESQALLIEAFAEIDKNQATIDDMKTWLLKQKQTQNWKTTKATAEACYALLLSGSNWLAEEKEVSISLGNTIINSNSNQVEAGTGYFKQTIPGEKVKETMGNIAVRIKSSPNQPATSTSWGAAYWQYFEDMDKVTTAATPLKLTKKIFVEKNASRGPVLVAINDGDELNVGDKVKVRIELKADRDMEYVHMKDMRAACMEPVNVISEYKWQGGLGYYESTKDASTNFFFNWLGKGTYVFEYSLYVTHAGNFSNGISSIQCMYAPEFSSHSEGIRVNVSDK
jgi:uncharacterized protein YfaS (alpha-2-macroglobulin family)